MPRNLQLRMESRRREKLERPSQATFGTITFSRTSMRQNHIQLLTAEQRKESMHLIIDKLISDFEGGGLSRRELVLSLAALVSSAQSAPGESGMRALSLNHVTVRVPDVQRTSRFYQELFGMPLKQHSEKTHILGVGKSFFGIEQKDGGPALDHYDFGIAGFNADQAAAKLKARNLTLEPGGTKESFKFRDPDGFLVQLNGPDYVGHVGS
jgi:catechol 2,3-dioxygenase-like lactoylglutathione lyase family enzyme